MNERRLGFPGLHIWLLTRMAPEDCPELDYLNKTSPLELGERRLTVIGRFDDKGTMRVSCDALNCDLAECPFYRQSVMVHPAKSDNLRAS